MTDTVNKGPMKRMLLVLGEDHEKTAAKYSENPDNMVEAVLFHQDKADEALANAHAALSAAVEMNHDPDDIELLRKLEDMTPDKFIETMIWNGAVLNEKGYYVERSYPNARYDKEKCGQAALEKRGEFSGIGTPFVLKDGSEAFVAKKGDIDWNEVHMVGSEDYELVWELCREGREPADDTEWRLKEYFKNRDYLHNFNSKEEFVKHNCSFWCYGVVDDEECILRSDFECTDLDWKENFYKNFIEPLDDDTVLALYSANIIG